MTFTGTFGGNTRRRVWVRGDSHPMKVTVFEPPTGSCLDGPFPRFDLTGSNVSFTMKLWRRLGEPLHADPVVVHKSSDNTEEIIILDQLNSESKGQAVIMLSHFDSKFLDPGIYRYDIQITSADGYVRTVINDEIYIRDDISSAEDGTAPPYAGAGGGSGSIGAGGVSPFHAATHGIGGRDPLSPAVIGAASLTYVNDLVATLTAMIENIDPTNVTVAAIVAHSSAVDPHGDRAWMATRSHFHSQLSPNTTWVINHNLGFRPVLATLTVGGVDIEGDVLHVSVNQVQVSFSVAIAGTARLT